MASQRHRRSTWWRVAVAAVLLAAAMTAGCAGPPQRSTTTTTETARPASDETQVRQVVEQLYGAIAANDTVAIERLLVPGQSNLARSLLPSDQTKIVGIEISSARVTGQTAEVVVVQRVQDRQGNAGVTQAAYALTKTPHGWKIASVRYAD